MPHSDLKLTARKSDFINLFPGPLPNGNTAYSGHQALQFLIPPSPWTSDGSSKPAIVASLSLESASALIWSLTSLSFAMVAVSNFRIWVYFGERPKQNKTNQPGILVENEKCYMAKGWGSLEENVISILPEGNEEVFTEEMIKF